MSLIKRQRRSSSAVPLLLPRKTRPLEHGVTPMKRPDLLGFPFGRVLGEDPQKSIRLSHTDRQLSGLSGFLHVPFIAFLLNCKLLRVADGRVPPLQGTRAADDRPYGRRGRTSNACPYGL